VRLQNEEGDFRIEFQGQIGTSQHDQLTGLYVGHFDLTVAGLRIPRPGTYRFSFTLDGQVFEGPAFLAKVQPAPVRH
jgi:hypothetical protein